MLVSKAKCSTVRMVASSTMDHRPQSLENRCPQTTWSVTQRSLRAYWVTRMPSSSLTGIPPERESTLFQARAEAIHSHDSNTLSGDEPRSETSTRTTPRNLLLQSDIMVGITLGISPTFHHRAAGPRHSPRFKNLTSPSGVARMLLELLVSALLLWNQHHAARRSQVCLRAAVSARRQVPT